MQVLSVHLWLFAIRFKAITLPWSGRPLSQSLYRPEYPQFQDHFILKVLNIGANFWPKLRDVLQSDACVGPFPLACRQAASMQPCGVQGSHGEGDSGVCPAMSTCFLPALSNSEELLRVRSSKPPSLFSTLRVSFLTSCKKAAVLRGHCFGSFSKWIQRNLTDTVLSLRLGKRWSVWRAPEVSRLALISFGKTSCKHSSNTFSTKCDGINVIWLTDLLQKC